MEDFSGGLLPQADQDGPPLLETPPAPAGKLRVARRIVRAPGGTRPSQPKRPRRHWPASARVHREDPDLHSPLRPPPLAILALSELAVSPHTERPRHLGLGIPPRRTLLQRPLKATGPLCTLGNETTPGTTNPTSPPDAFHDASRRKQRTFARGRPRWHIPHENPTHSATSLKGHEKSDESRVMPPTSARNTPLYKICIAGTCL